MVHAAIPVLYTALPNLTKDMCINFFTEIRENILIWKVNKSNFSDKLILKLLFRQKSCSYSCHYYNLFWTTSDRIIKAQIMNIT